MKNLSESLEKYLLAVYELSKVKECVMVKDVSKYLKLGGSSSADAIKALAKKGVIKYVPYSAIELTKEGIELIELKIYRHKTISNFLNKVLDIEKESADINAHALEYSMTQDVLVKFVHFLDFMEQCTCQEPKWIKSCKKSLENGEVSSKCKSCISKNSNCGSCCTNCGGH